MLATVFVLLSPPYLNRLGPSSDIMVTPYSLIPPSGQRGPPAPYESPFYDIINQESTINQESVGLDIRSKANALHMYNSTSKD